MPRHIDADQMISDTEAMKQVCEAIEIDGIIKYIEEHIASDVQEVKHAHWIIIEYEYLNCSHCGESYYTGAESTEQAKEWLEKGYAYSYCPYCGAKMDEKEKEDE